MKRKTFICMIIMAAFVACASMFTSCESCSREMHSLQSDFACTDVSHCLTIRATPSKYGKASSMSSSLTETQPTGTKTVNV